MLLAQVKRDDPGRPAAIYHYHLDHLGTPKELTNDNGEIVWSVQLKAWAVSAGRLCASVGPAK
ncbi:RHS domain-containing protein [Telmatospirillum sp.]|uniref:RHS domain-containing protein n=1 Tax=Telmatospirillum sp. TaxID=2079197 RepID=UPI002847D20D|nr:RHS domain-containing protein [Telmatospirillum sp.]MDR3435275.1 RHS domain-containing protein [Telmatospirillum sp.]